jgi:hypothetical protein
MSKQAILGQVTARLAQLGIRFQAGQRADLAISTEFVDAGWSTGSKRIVYEASVYLDEASQTAFMWEKTTETGSGLSAGYDGGTSFQSGKTLFRKVKSIQYGPDGRAFEIELDLGAIPKAVKETASQYGWKFKTVLSKAKAEYPAGYAAIPYMAPPQPMMQQQASPQPMAAAAALFCSHCGSALTPDTRFCSNCGQPVDTLPAPVVSAGYAAPAPAYSIPAQPYPVPPVAGAASGKLQGKSYKTMAIIAYSLLALLLLLLFIIYGNSLLGWIASPLILGGSVALQTKLAKKGCVTGFIVFLVTGAVLLVTFLATTPDTGKSNGIGDPTSKATTTVNSTVGATTEETQREGQEKSSKVSLGVNLDDLGNITNGQYFYDNGTYQFYSSFDENACAHIYRTDIKTQETIRIFDGFGWSLVTNKGWLYFSGNSGTKIDGTYNLFRMKIDGSGLENINTGYCFGMSIYQDWLYYVKKSDVSASDYAIYRCGLDGSGEEALVTDFNGYGVLYDNSLFYVSANGTLNRAKPEGRSPVALLGESVSKIIIGNGQLIYLDAAGNIKTAGIDGQNIQQIRAAGSLPVYSLNSMKDKVFYTLYDPNFDQARYAYAYELYRMNLDGSDNQKIYAEYSYGTFINVVNGRVFTLDYAVNPDTGMMPAIARSMDFSGGNVTNLPR